MKAIAVIFVRTRDVKLPAGQPTVVPISEGSQGVAVLGGNKTNRADKSTIHNDSGRRFGLGLSKTRGPTLRDLSVALRI